MKILNLSTPETAELSFLPGTYQLNLTDFNTSDQSDSWGFTLINGAAILTDPWDRETELDGDRPSYAWYLDRQLFTLTIFEASTIAFYTDEGWDYPYDDIATNPTATLEIETLSQEPITIDLTQMEYETFGNVDTETATLSTGSRDRAASSLGNWVMGDRSYLKQFGTEGSGLYLKDLAPGHYSLDWSMYSKDQSSNADALYAWNGKALTVLGDRDGETQISSARWINDGSSTVDVLYGDLYLFAMDATDKKGTTEFSIENMEYEDELDFIPQQLDISDNSIFGDYRDKEKYVQISTGSKDRAISSVARKLGTDLDILTGMGITEGSLMTYTLPEEDLKIEMTWQYLSRDVDPLGDKVLMFDEFGTILQDIDLSGFQNIGTGKTFTSEKQTLSLSLDEHSFSIGVFDTADKVGSSYVRVTNLEVVG